MSKFTDKINMSFKYTPAAATDIRHTLNKERRRLAELREQEAARPRATVKQIKEAKK
jgi:hypothetical protein